jgi:hypothetical protein
MLVCLVLGACSLTPTIPVKGEFFGERVETTVDSETARYYLENYLPGKHNNRELDRRIAALYNRHRESIPSREELNRISREYSVDFASLFLADRLLSDECNRLLNQSFSQLLNSETAVTTDISSYLLLFVPGWDYAETGYLTGADFAKPRELATAFGLKNELVALPPTGGVEENADVLAAEISRHIHSGKQILLVGASSAGPAIHLVLGERLAKHEIASIKAWLNIGGILQGSPLVDHLQTWPRSWLFSLIAWQEGWDKQAIMSMATEPSRSRFARLHIDSRILVINYLGIPLSGQPSRYARDYYQELRANGPNDGLTLLADAIAPGSLTIVALGSDHFIAEDPRINKKTVALMKLLITSLEKDQSRTCSRFRHEGLCDVVALWFE